MTIFHSRDGFVANILVVLSLLSLTLAFPLDSWNKIEGTRLDSLRDQICHCSRDKGKAMSSISWNLGRSYSGTRLYYKVVQGSSLQVFPFASSQTSRSLRIDMMTDGRPLEGMAELWQGPNYCPQKFRVYSENGNERPFCVSIEAPTDTEFSCAIKNTGETFEFPLSTIVRDLNHLEDAEANPFYYSELFLEDKNQRSSNNGIGNVLSRRNGRIIQGGAIRSFNFAPQVDKIQVLLETSGLPLWARIEVSQGPDNNKQVVDIYSEDGQRFPLYLAIDLPSSSRSDGFVINNNASPISGVEGVGHVMRIINAATMEFPLKVFVDAYTNGLNSNAMASTLEQALDFDVVPQVPVGFVDGNVMEDSNQNWDNFNDIPSPRVPTIEDSKYYPTW